MSDSNEASPVATMQNTQDWDSARGVQTDMASDATANELDNPRGMFHREEEWASWPMYIKNFSYLFIIVFIPTFIFNLLFSDMTAAGLGTHTFEWLSTKYVIAIACGSFGFVTLVLTYLFDGFKYWKDSHLVWRQYVVFSIVGFCFVIGGFFAAREYPFSPHAVSLMIFLCYAYGMWCTLLDDWDQPKFLYYMWRVLLLMGCCLFIFFCCWVFAFDHLWDNDNKARIADEMSNDDWKCEYKSDTDSYCLHAFLVWFSPFFLSGVFIMFSVVVYFLEAYVTDNTSGTKDLAFRGFLTLIALSAMSVWAAASVAGAGMDLATAVVAFMFSATVWIGVLAVATIGFENMQKRFFAVPLVKKMEGSILNEWFKALFIMCFFWVIVFYFFASCLNQRLRTWNCTRKKGKYSSKDLRHRLKSERNSQFQQKVDESDDEQESSSQIDLNHDSEELATMKVGDKEETGPKEDSEGKFCCRLTKAASRHFYTMYYWNWTSLSLKIVVWGVLYLTLMVFTTKFITIFLAWLGSVIESWNFGVVIVIFMAIGLTMFLLPPVPGVPVYLTGGIIIPAAAEANGMNFWVGVAIASGICCVVKFMAIVCQQKLIGERFGQSIWVRRFVGVNSLSIRAIEKILTKKGMAIDKVSILVGGPDWPTSVLTGILGLDIFEMLLGSCPILFLIAPTCMAGAMLKKGAEGGVYAALSTTTLTVAALLQGVALLSAMHYIEKTAFQYEEELMNKPDDAVVARLDAIGDKFRKIYYESVQWHQLDTGHRMMLGGAAMLMIFVCFIIQLFDSSCFETFELTAKMEDPPLRNNPLRLFKPLGIVATVMFFISVSMWYAFHSWAIGQLQHNDEFIELKKEKRDILEQEKENPGSDKREPDFPPIPGPDFPPLPDDDEEINEQSSQLITGQMKDEPNFPPNLPAGDDAENKDFIASTTNVDQITDEPNEKNHSIQKPAGLDEMQVLASDTVE